MKQTKLKVRKKTKQKQKQKKTKKKQQQQCPVVFSTERHPCLLYLYVYFWLIRVIAYPSFAVLFNLFK